MNAEPKNFRELLAVNEGLQHETNKALFQNKSDFGGIAEMLLEKSGKEVFLDMLIHRTADSAKKHIRKSYLSKLLRKQTVAAEDEESRLERAAWLRWRIGRKKKPASKFLPQCPYLVAYQLPLFNKQMKAGWGYIDLLGLSPDDLAPIVIELKKGESSESPLRMLLEATAYTIALKEAWDLGLRDDWGKALASLALPPDEQAKLHLLPKELETCTAICVAPADYWKSCAPGSCREYSNEAWKKFRAVQTHLAAVWKINTIFAECFFECREWSPGNRF